MQAWVPRRRTRQETHRTKSNLNLHRISQTEKGSKKKGELLRWKCCLQREDHATCSTSSTADRKRWHCYHRCSRSRQVSPPPDLPPRQFCLYRRNSVRFSFIFFLVDWKFSGKWGKEYKVWSAFATWSHHIELYTVIKSKGTKEEEEEKDGPTEFQKTIGLRRKRKRRFGSCRAETITSSSPHRCDDETYGSNRMGFVPPRSPPRERNTSREEERPGLGKKTTLLPLLLLLQRR